MKTVAQRQALGAFLRAHRERLAVPAAAIRRRRTPGWRREEVAEACGVSLTWITWLEQGRDVSASPGALARIAEVLQLTVAERAYLFGLADRRDPAGLPEHTDELPASILSLPNQVTVPAYLLDRTWTARAWNRPAAALFRGWLDRDYDRNLLRFVFLSGNARKIIADWDDRARRLVAEFRSDFSRHLRDPSMQLLIDELIRSSPEFHHCWQQQAVLSREGGERRFHRPSETFHQSTLTVVLHPDVKLVVLTPMTRTVLT